jgi:hypothetical protein
MTITRHSVGAFRLERCFDRLDLRSEGLQRLFERRIAAQAHAVFLYLDWYVTVAEVPRQSRERRGVVNTHFEKRFGFCDDFYNAAIVEQQRVVGAKAHGLRKIKFHASAFHAEEKTALMDTVMRVVAERRVTVLFVEHDMDVVRRYVSRILAFYSGEVLADGVPEQVLANPRVQEFVTGSQKVHLRAAL